MSTWAVADEQAEWVAVIGPFEVVMSTFDEVAAYVSWVDAGCPEPDEFPEYARAHGLVSEAAQDEAADDAEHAAEHRVIEEQVASMTGTGRNERARRSLTARHMLARHLIRFHDVRPSDGRGRQSLEAEHRRLHRAAAAQ
jgi:hypothetical protein